jgi:hypothetical protein
MPALQTEPAHESKAFEVLAYEAPFVIEKLVKDRVVDSAEEGRLLFGEVKRYLLLVGLSDGDAWHMYSLRVDEAWHQFILFTRQYVEFCKRYFGRYIPHSPSNAPLEAANRPVRETSFTDFRERYEELFGVPLPDIWYDSKNVTVRRRVINDRAGMLRVRANLGEANLLSVTGETLFSVNDLAQSALEFIAGTGAFYVRELPGDLTDDEKTALVSILMEGGILRSAP